MNIKPAKILVADDEPLYLRTTGDLLRKAGFECVCVSDGVTAMQRLREENVDLVLSDLNMPGNFKLELLHDHCQTRPHVPMIVVTGVPTLPTAIESVRLGITDYLLKPVRFEDLLVSVRRAILQGQRLRAQTRPIPDRSELATLFPHIIGRSPPMLELFEILDRISPTDTNVLITGESGTGKEVVAQTIHTRSHRQSGKFQVIDCTAVPESLFESMLFGHKKGSFTGAVSDAEGLLKQCDGGTAFFDEIGELPATLQSKLLRAVQEQTFTPVGSHTPVTVDTRFICATNRDLEVEVTAGRFRQDLFYRLGVIHVELPPLRDRGDDVILLARHFLEVLRPKGASVVDFSGEALQCLRQYKWPGNIRELRNSIERAIALARGPQIVASDFPSKILSSETVGLDNGPAKELGSTCRKSSTALDVLSNLSREQALEAAEYQYLVKLMEAFGGNVSEAARQAGLSRQGMHKLLKKHDIPAAEFRS